MDTAPDVDVGDASEPTAVPPVQGVPTVVSLQTDEAHRARGRRGVDAGHGGRVRRSTRRGRCHSGRPGVVVNPGVALVTVKHSLVVEPSVVPE